MKKLVILHNETSGFFEVCWKEKKEMMSEYTVIKKFKTWALAKDFEKKLREKEDEKTN